MTLEGRSVARGARQAGGFRLGPCHDRGPDVGFQREMDVHHAELIAVAASASRGVLALRQISVLFGIEPRLSGPLL